MNLCLLLPQLLASARPDEIAGDSVRNYHAVGVDYLCLLRTARLTVKIYLFNEALQTTGVRTRFGTDPLGADAAITGPWLVWPHNHRYAFEHRTLSGGIANLRFYLDQGAEFDVHAYSYGDRSTARIGVSGLHCREVERGQAFAMANTDELHTIAIESRTAIASQAQYHDSGNRQTMLVAPRGTDVSCGDNPALYLRPTSDDVRMWLDLVRGVA